MSNYLMEELQKEKLSTALPNEMFNDLLQMIHNKELKPVHVGFTYSYIYLQTYLYRYAMYGRTIPSVEDIKEVLTYSRSDKRTNYITKKNGLLESKGLLEVTTEFPILTEYENADTSLPTFTTIREHAKEYSDRSVDQILKELNATRRSTCMYPVFAFLRYVDENGVGEEGTFYDTRNTTLLDMQTFMFCMTNEGIGVNGFYLYAYLLHQNYKYSNNFSATAQRISSELGLSEKTVKRLLSNMRQHNMINTLHNMDCISFAIPKEDRKASTHSTNIYSDFTIEKINTHKVLSFVSEKWYIENEMSKKVGISSSDLPF